MPPIAAMGTHERVRLTSRRAMQIARDLAVEVGWQEGIVLAGDGAGGTGSGSN
jgi:hypothetical protein